MPLGLLNPFASKQDDNNKPSRINGIGFFNDSFESDESYTPAPNADSNFSFKIPDVFQDVLENTPKLVFDPASSLARESAGAMIDLIKEAFPIKGSINFKEQRNPDDQKKKDVFTYQRSFYASLESSRKDNQSRTVEQSLEEAARLSVQAMSSEEKNKTLRLNMSLDKKYTQNPYHIHTLRKIKLDELKAMTAQKQSQDLAAASKSGGLLSNMNAHEGQSMTSSSGAIISAG